MASASTVAVVVPSPATSLVLLAASFTSFAPMFSYLSLSSISSATVTPSLVMVGAPQPLSMTAFRPRGPRVALTARDNFITPSRSDLRASVSKDSILAAMNLLLERDQDFEFRLDEQAVSAETHSAQGYWQWVCRDIHKGGEQPSTATSAVYVNHVDASSVRPTVMLAAARYRLPLWQRESLTDNLSSRVPLRASHRRMVRNI